MRNTKLDDESSGGTGCFLLLIMAMDSEQAALSPRAPVPAMGCYGDLTLEKEEGRPGEIAPSQCVEVQLGSVTRPSIRLSTPLSAELLSFSFAEALGS